MIEDETMKSNRTAKQDYDLLLAEETLILEVQIAIQQSLNEKGITQADLARRLDVSESYVSQMLGASARNLTLRTVARVMAALGETPCLTIKRQLEQFAQRVRPYECDADFGPWGEIVILEPATEEMRTGWWAREWAANENTVAEPEWAEVA